MRTPGEVTEVGTIISETKALDNKYFPVIERVIQTPDGETREPQLLWDRGGKTFAVAIALTPDNQFVLIREPKYGQMKKMLVVPTGAIKKDETPEQAAAREFLEETGYEVESWVMLRQTPVVDFADKTDGGEHFFFFGRNARKVQEPEQYREVILLGPDSVQQALLREVQVAVSLVGLWMAVNHFYGFLK